MRLTKWIDGRIHKQNEEQDFDLWEIDIIKKLAAYEDAEEQGRLVILPCKAGDSVHFIFRGKVYSGLILHVNLYKGFETQSITMDVKYSVRGHVLICAEEIGKTAFLTREEAEAALKGEQNDV